MAVMRGVVTRLEGGKPHVEVADLGAGYAFGPCEVATSDPIAKGDRVFVASVGDTIEDLAVIGLIDPPPTSSTPSGPAGGDLTGTYPNPGVSAARIQAVGDPRYVQLTDPRLTNARTPTAHTHDDRYFTETESDARFAAISHGHPFSAITGTIAEAQLLNRLTQASLDARYALSGAAPAAHNHDTLYPRKIPLTALTGSTAYTRIAYLDGQGTTNGANVTLAIANQGNYGSTDRCTSLVQFSQRGTNGYRLLHNRFGAASSGWTFYVVASGLIAELWALRPAYDAGSITVLSSNFGGVDTTPLTQAGAPAGAILQGAPASLDEAVIRVVHGTNAGIARPAALYVEWMGTVLPTNMGPNDSWINTSP